MPTPKDQTTTIQVYKRDKQLLKDTFGGFEKEAFRKLLKNTCTHPEEKRSYVMAELPAAGDDAITEEGETRKVGGFLCTACGNYIFRKENALRVK